MNAIETTPGKKDVRIDFAPMVDLGFLLITFFIFTTEMTKPKAFGLNVPDKGDSTQSPVSSTITLTLNENGVVNYLEGNTQHVLAKGVAYLYGKPSLRDQLIDKRKCIIKENKSDEQYTVIIQPTAQTKYKELVDILDEMTINDIKRYVLLDQE